MGQRSWLCGMCRGCVTVQTPANNSNSMSNRISSFVHRVIQMGLASRGIWICIVCLWSLPFLAAFRLSALSRTNARPRTLKMEIFEGNPIGKAIWNAVWKLPLLQPGEQGKSPTTFGDAALVLRNNILQIYGNETSYDGAPVAEGDVSGFLDGSAYLGLQVYEKKVASKF